MYNFYAISSYFLEGHKNYLFLFIIFSNAFSLQMWHSLGRNKQAFQLYKINFQEALL